MTTRKILCIRHGESTFNAANVDGGPDPMLFDAPLTERGHAQVAEARLLMRDTPVDLVLTTPLTRALQTSLGIFADHPSRPEIVVETRHRERLESSCDRGRSPADLMREFPQIRLEHLPVTWWYAEGEPDARGIHVEPLDIMLARMEAFAEHVRQRSEPVLAVVGHATFFHHLTGQWLKNCQVLEWDWAAPAGSARAL